MTTHRTTVISGPRASGKTRLATEMAAASNAQTYIVDFDPDAPGFQWGVFTPAAVRMMAQTADLIVCTEDAAAEDAVLALVPGAKVERIAMEDRSPDGA